MFTTEVEYQDEHGNIEVRTVSTPLSPAGVALAEQLYTANNISHDEAVRQAVATTGETPGQTTVSK